MTSMTKNHVTRAQSPTGFGARVLLALALVGVFTTACDVHGVSDPGTLASIIVTPNATLTVGATQQMTAVGYDAEGQVVTISPTWTVAASGGTVASSGVFTAGGVPGLFANTVVASVGSLSGRASITVIPGPLATITVSPTPVTLAVAATQQFTAVGKDASGNVVPMTPVWSVAAAGGTIGSTGLFVAGGTLGTFANTVKATSGTLSGTATVTVTVGPLASITITPNPATMAIGSTQQLTAVGKDAAGNVVTMTPIWDVVTTSNGASVTQTGLYTAGTVVGTFPNKVRAKSGSVAGFGTIIATTGVLATITVTPNPVFMQTAGVQQFTAVGQDAFGNVFAITPVWSVASGGGVIDAGTGIFIAGLTAGTFTNTVVATSGTVTGRATVNVAATLATILVNPNPVSVVVSGTQQFAATGRDAAGNVFPISPVWSIGNGGGTISAGGLFTAGLVTGTYSNTVRATSGSFAGTATVTVTATPPALATITVTPNPASMLINATQQFAAIGRDGSGNIFPVSPDWTVVAGGGTIDIVTGLFTAGGVAGSFPNTVRAASGLISGTATVTVTVAPAAPLVDFGIAAPNGIMAGASVTCSGLGVVNADISISPGSTMTGFGPCIFTGVTHLGDPTAALAQIALTNAYNTLMGQPCPAANNFGTVDYNGKVLPAGVYCSGSTINVTGALTLDGGGDPNATFVFQSGSATIGAANIVLIGSAQAKNVYWVAGSSVTLNASAWSGNIVALQTIELKVNTTLLGRALARNGSVTMDATANVINLP